MNIQIVIATCVFPKGLKRLLESIYTHTPEPYSVTVCMDGNEEYKRLDQMEQYKPAFLEFNDAPGVQKTDHERLNQQNEDTQDYSFLTEYESRKNFMLLRNPKNKSAIFTFNKLFHAGMLGDIVILFTDDVFVQGGWLKPIITLFTNFPNVCLGGYSNVGWNGFVAFEDLGRWSDVAACPIFRGVYVRELIHQRGWVMDPRFKILNADVSMILEVRKRGHDIGFIAEPRRIGNDKHHISLGKWKKDEIGWDKRTNWIFPIELHPNKQGKQVFIRLEGDDQTIKKLLIH